MKTNVPYLQNNPKYPPIILCDIQAPKYHYYFSKKQQQQIKDIVLNQKPLQIILKYIHIKFRDEGLLYTLVHKIYKSSNQEIEFYVPQLVYLAIKKNCKPIKSLLIHKAQSFQSLRRLILWNVKAFTVLMKNKDLEVKSIIEQFEQNLIDNVKNRNHFNHSEKAIAMITTASLILKKMEPLPLKQKLQKFIQRYNREYLNNLKHAIIIPFRKGDNQKVDSNYVVRIVEQDCSCFPTRKRVPYRIIIETIDQNQLSGCQPTDQFFKQTKIQPDAQRDLYDQVAKSVQEMFGYSHKYKSLSLKHDNATPFVDDPEKEMKLKQLSKFAKKVIKQEKQLQKQNNLVMSKVKNGYMHRKNTMYSKDSDNFHRSVARFKDKYQINNDMNLKKFQAIYIPTLPSSMRKSACHVQSIDDLFLMDKSQKKKRWSGTDSLVKLPQSNVKEVQQQTRWNPADQQSAWGVPWVSKQKKYKQTSFFRNFSSLKLHNVVVKGGDDLRQEIVCMQLIFKMKEIIKKAQIDIYIKPYEIIVLSENSGILQFVSNSISIDSMKKQREGLTISEFFSQQFQTEQKLIKAKQNFIRALVGSSLMTYVLKLKDRHNGNILLDNQGHIIHIDFGFILGMSPGGINFQSSPFKLTEQYVDFMGGKGSPDYNFFEELFYDGMVVLRQKMDQLCLVLQIMMQQSDLQCFQNFKIESFKDRLQPTLNQAKFKQYCYGLIQKSCMNNRTVQYDFFQYYTNGILS